VVPTWNYVAVQAHGPLEVFDDEERLLAIVVGLTDGHEAGRAEPWAVTDAPEAYIRAQLRGILGLRLPIAQIEGVRKMSQNKCAADRSGVAAGLSGSERPVEREAAGLVPLDE
jgi:transcriptional regulator